MTIASVIEGDLAPAYTLDPNFPRRIKNEVLRPHVVETLREEVDENDIAFVEGQQGSGATVLLSQFCREVDAHVFCAFIRPSSRFAYDPSYVRSLLADQIDFFLEGVRKQRDAIDPSEFALLVLRLRKAARGKQIYFVIDGLHQIPAADRVFADQIMREVLPIGVGGFRFLISGPSSSLAENLRAQGYGTFRVPKLSDSEAESLIASLEISDADKKDIIRASRGNPGRLSSVVRLHSSGVASDKILELDWERYLDFVKLEFDQCDSLDDLESECIATVAFVKHLVTKAELTLVLGIGPAEIDSLVEKFSVLTCDEFGVLGFVSEAHRRYAERKFERLRSKVIERQIAHLRTNPDTAQALQFLPGYYQMINNEAAIVELLRSPDHYVKLLATTQSMSALRARAMMGARSATELREAVSVFQFALQQGIFAVMAAGLAQTAEVRALVALGEPQRALNVASKAASNESRLFLLAEYARGMRERGEVLDPDVVAYIRGLFKGLDPSDLGADIQRLAENLLFVDADLALSLFDKADASERGSRDAAIAQLAVVSMTSQANDREAIGEKTRQRIHNESLQKTLASLNAIVADASFDEVKAIAETLEAGRRIHFLRSLATSPSAALDVAALVEFALDEIVRESAYRPTMRDFLDLAQPLSRLASSEHVRGLLRRLEGQIRVIENSASSKDLVLAGLCLARADAVTNMEASIGRLESAFDRTTGIDGVETKVDCLAIILEVLYSQDAPWGTDEKVVALKQSAKEALVAGVHVLLNGAAEHFGVVESALTSIARYDAESAMAIAAGLNMASRRDDAFSLIAKEVSRKPKVESSLLERCISCITERWVRDAVLTEIVEWRDSLKGADGLLPSLVWAQSQIVDPRLRARSAIHLIEACLLGGLNSAVPEIEAQLQQEITRVDSAVERVDLLYSASAVLAKNSVDQSIFYFELASELAAKNALGSEASFDLIRMCLSLLLRVMRPVLQANAQAEQFLHRFERLVSLLPCRATQAAYLAELAEKAWAEGKGDICRRIVSDHLRPLLDTLEHGDPLTARLSAIIYPAVFLGHRASSQPILDAISKRDAARALHSTAMVVLRKASPSEAWQGEDRELKLSYEDVQDVLALLELSTTDHAFYSILTTLSKAVSGKYGRRKLTVQQRSYAADRVIEMVNRKFPDPDNIQHDGYAVVSLARAHAMMERADSAWESLIEQGRAIGNVADRQYVLIEIADSLPARNSALRKSLMQEAYSLIKDIPAVLDRLGRLECYVSAVRRFDTAAAKEALREAMTLTFEVDKDEYVASARRNLIDVAELIEPGFAEKIAEAIEDDPARKEAKSAIARAAALQKFKRQISSAKTEKDRAQVSQQNLPSAAWKNVGSLVSSRIEPLQPERMLEYLDAAARFGFDDAFPVLAWYIENVGRRYTTRTDIEMRVVPLAEVMFLCTELAADMLQSAAAGSDVMRFRVKEHEDASGVVLGPQDRGAALEYLRAWLRQEAGDEILLCDPYFSLNDLDFFRLVLLEAPEARVVVLTSKKKFGRVTDEEIEREWNSLVDQDPPAAEIISISELDDDRSPVHDRWLLSESAGLRLGTSFSSLGTGRITEISVVERARVESLRAALAPFVRRDRIVSDKRVQYSSMSL